MGRKLATMPSPVSRGDTATSICRLLLSTHCHKDHRVLLILSPISRLSMGCMREARRLGVITVPSMSGISNSERKKLIAIAELHALLSLSEVLKKADCRGGRI